jgi:uncharacterized protein YecA (UPF0149 family)
MPDIPAFCDKCGAIFRSGIFIGGGTATLVGNKAGPCPMCASMGTIPDGVYSAAGNVLRLLSGPHKTVEQLIKLAAIIAEARRVQEEPNQIAEKIKQEAPELSSLVDALPKTRSELYNFILVICAAVTVLLTAAVFNKEDAPSEAEIERMVEDTVRKAIQESQKQPPIIEKKQPYIAPEKPSRNSPCSCGSEKKYKHCCGRII